jgi:hypothetical protein
MSTRAALLLSSMGGFRCPNCRSQQRWKIKSSPSQRLNSLTAVASCRDCDHTIFLKKMEIIDGVPAEQSAENEFNAASKLNTLFEKSPEFGVVEPLDRIGSLLIFKHITGITPVAELKVAPLDDAASIMRRLGLWFAKLHHASEKGKQTGDLAGRFESMMSWSRRQKPYPVLGKALSYLKTQLPELETASSRYCQLHGDAKPENFLIEGDRIIGIDISWRFLQFPENDLAQFLTQYELSVCGLFGTIDNSRRRILEDAFLDGYRSSIVIDEAVLAWLRIYFLLHLWFSSREMSMFHRLRWDIFFIRRMDCLLLELHNF